MKKKEYIKPSICVLEVRSEILADSKGWNVDGEHQGDVTPWPPTEGGDGGIDEDPDNWGNND